MKRTLRPFELIEPETKDEAIRYLSIYGQRAKVLAGGLNSAKALLDKYPNPTREDVKSALAGNLCRCTGYVKIIHAVLAAAETKKGTGK